MVPRVASWLCVWLVVLLPSVAWAAVVSGFVTESDATPIVGATIQINYPGTSTEVTSAVSDGGGWYELSVRDDTYDIEVVPAVGSPFLPQTLRGIAVADETTVNLVLVPARPVTLSGAVRDRAGTGLGGVSMCLRAVVGGQQVCTGSGTDGGYALTVVPGDYTMRASANSSPTGLVPNSYSSVYFNSVIALASDTTQDFAIEANTIVGHVTDVEGGPVAGVQVVADSSNSGTDWRQSGRASAYTNDEGFFELSMFDGPGRIDLIPPAETGLGSLRHSLEVSGDLNIELGLPDPVTLSGIVSDRDGAVLSGASLCLRAVAGSQETCGSSGEDGAFAVTVVPGDYTARVRGNSMATGLIPNMSFSASFLDALSLAEDTIQNFVVEGSLVTGVVVGGDGQPVSGVRLQGYGTHSDTQVSAYGWDQVYSDDDGEFELVLFEGDGYVDIYPSASSGFAAMRSSLAVTHEMDIELALPEPVAVSGVVTDRDGTGLTGVSVCLRPAAGGPQVCVNSGAGGNYALTAAPGEYNRVRAADSYAPAGIVPGENFRVDYYDFPALEADVTRDFVVEANRVPGRVVDADGNPVSDVGLRAYTANSSSEFTQSGNARAVSDSGGGFEFALFSGSGWIDATPSESSGMASFRLSNLAIVGDQVLGILLQFISDSVVGDVEEGESVTTDDEGDGATPADPVETSVTSPQAGTISIQEAPITQREPDGYRFLTQQINITAPPASADDPLRIVFTMDGSRIPAGMDPLLVQIFRNGEIVLSCRAPGDVDPCVLSRQVLADGDLEIVVLTSAASEWNFGVPEVVDTDADGIGDDEDDCPLEAEDRDGFQDDDGCPDLDNDEDGLPDLEDSCPDESEDEDGFEDDDGCPELDNDDDGIDDLEDSCPDEPEDEDGFEDEDGCPDVDNDGDGIADEFDVCPDEAEDEDGFEDEDGCPEEGEGEPSCEDVDDLDGWTRIDLIQIWWRIGAQVGEPRYLLRADLDVSNRINWIDFLIGLERYYRCRDHD